MVQPSDQAFGTLRWQDLSLELLDSSGSKCECCESETRRVWGLVRDPAGPLASYFVTWTVGLQDHHAAFDLIIGKWGEGAIADNRAAVSLRFGISTQGPGFYLVDATDQRISDSGLVGRSLTRSEVIKTSLAGHCFVIADAILRKDPRIAELREWV